MISLFPPALYGSRVDGVGGEGRTESWGNSLEEKEWCFELGQWRRPDVGDFEQAESTGASTGILMVTYSSLIPWILLDSVHPHPYFSQTLRLIF